jgi:hypothetical protein
MPKVWFLNDAGRAGRRGLALAFLCLALVGLPAATPPTQAQAVSTGSTGADGDLSLTAPGLVIFDPKASNPPLDIDGDNIFHFRTITIGAGVTVRLAGDRLNGPVVWLATGAVQIDGTIDLNGANGQTKQEVVTTGSRLPAVPGAGGFSGGVGIGATTQSLPQPGSGPGGGGAAMNSHGAGASYATDGHKPSSPDPGPLYGNDFIVPLIGGSGGGGAGRNDYPPSTGTSFSGGGGGGGGALLIASDVSITVAGSITANGGHGDRFSGGGSGGAIRLVAPTIGGGGSLLAQRGGGDGAMQYGTGQGFGGLGRIRLEALQHAFTGSSNPEARRGAPAPLHLDQARPWLRIVSVANAAVPAVPRADFGSPDATISSNSELDVTIEARGVPTGTLVTLVVLPETGVDIVTDSGPLVGTLQQSTATAKVTLPPGNSRLYVRAKWTP